MSGRIPVLIITLAILATCSGIGIGHAYNASISNPDNSTSSTYAEIYLTEGSAFISSDLIDGKVSFRTADGRLECNLLAPASESERIVMLNLSGRHTVSYEITISFENTLPGNAEFAFYLEDITDPADDRFLYMQSSALCKGMEPDLSSIDSSSTNSFTLGGSGLTEGEYRLHLYITDVDIVGDLARMDLGDITLEAKACV